MAAELRRGIASGLYPVGTRLPSQRDLMARESVSDRTVHAALDQLAREGLVERIQGSGTWVRQREPIPTTESRLAALEDDVAALKRHLGID